MKIGGFQKFSLIDYPGKISCIIFTRGCNFRCFGCHNPELVYPEIFITPLKEEILFEFLKKRKGKLEAVVITGGEPTIQPDLAEFIEKIKKMDYSVKLDTNGSNPDVLEKIIENKLVDYIAMDIKAPPEKYSSLIGRDIVLSSIFKSIRIIENSSIEYEFRTTFVPSLLSEDDILKIKKMIKDEERYRIQRFRKVEKKVPIR
mgnify:CR=1 FL=1